MVSGGVLRRGHDASSAFRLATSSFGLFHGRAVRRRDMSRLVSTISCDPERTYENAIRILDSRRRVGGRPPPDGHTSESSTSKSQLRGAPSLVGMAEWLRMLGHSDADINSLNIIHVAGTKGKGSTCSLTESFLRAHGARTGFPRKTGLYTSPHLIHVEERIRLDAHPISHALLSKYFFELYDVLPQLSVAYDPAKPPVERGPRYLQLWALLAFHVFVREGVDSAILETHNGGEYDATNVVTRPVVTAITTLGMDHIEMLGPTIEDIAWHKAGIYKAGATALSTLQDPALHEVLSRRAGEKGETVRFIDRDPRLPPASLQLQQPVQRQNASLAVAAAEAFLSRCTPAESAGLTEADIRIGVEQWSWPGRFQIFARCKETWFLDSAHNDMSVALAATWFVEGSSEMRRPGDVLTRILIFSHINELRDIDSLLRSLATALRDCDASLDHVIFSSYDARIRSGREKKHSTPELFHTIWKEILPGTEIWDKATVEGAISLAKRLGNTDGSVHVLVTGSQHLVGPALQILQCEESACGDQSV